MNSSVIGQTATSLISILNLTPWFSCVQNTISCRLPSGNQSNAFFGCYIINTCRQRHQALWFSDDQTVSLKGKNNDNGKSRREVDQ